MTVTVPVSELKQRTGDVLGKAVVDRQDVIVERYGRDYVVILSMERYQQLRDSAQAYLADRYRRAQEEVWEATEDIPVDEIDALVATALAESRRERAGLNASHP